MPIRHGHMYFSERSGLGAVALAAENRRLRARLRVAEDDDKPPPEPKKPIREKKGKVKVKSKKRKTKQHVGSLARIGRSHLRLVRDMNEIREHDAELTALARTPPVLEDLSERVLPSGWRLDRSRPEQAIAAIVLGELDPSAVGPLHAQARIATRTRPKDEPVDTSAPARKQIAKRLGFEGDTQATLTAKLNEARAKALAAVQGVR